jgi:exodeoxyribonuclease VII large subunit
MCDVVIIGRGGGAAEDLAAFNDERLARAIFACTVPTVSAVGHETDECIADLVADVRAPTPSAAAELCVPNGHDLISAAGGLLHRSHAYTYRAMRDARLDLESVVAHIDRQHPRARIARARQDVDAMASASRRSIDQLLETQRRRVDETTARAALLDPRDVLRRGYAIVSQRRQGCVRRITSASAARAAGNLELTFHDGTLRTSVDRDGT